MGQTTSIRQRCIEIGRLKMVSGMKQMSERSLGVNPGNGDVIREIETRVDTRATFESKR